MYAYICTYAYWLLDHNASEAKAIAKEGNI